VTFQPRGRYWDDLNVGDEFWAAGRTVLEADMASFAALSGDFNPLHMDVEFAKSSAFGERIPHGPLGLMFAMGGIDRIGLLEGVAVAFLDLRWRFVAPLRIGDTARVRLVVHELKATRAADRGILVLGVELHNQHGEVVQEGQQTFLVQRRPT
jgi:acyl dehydratase